MKKSFGMRVLSGLTSVLLAVSNLPSLMAGAATSYGSNNYLDDVTLLVGDGDGKGDYDVSLRAETVEQTINNYNDHYALGIASLFCVFVADYFIPHNSDAEGRVAIGSYFESKLTDDNGNLIEYQIGKGNYSNNTPLEKLIGVNNYARLIWNARSETFDYVDGSSLVGPKLTRLGWQKYDGSNTSLNVAYTKSSEAETIISNQYSDHKDDFYGTSSDLIDIDGQFTMLENRSNQISKVKNEFTFDSYTQKLYSGNNDPEITIVTLTYNVASPDPTETVYINLDELTQEQREIFDRATIIRFENIPELPADRPVVTIDASDTSWNLAYIVINDSRSGDVTVGMQNSWTDQYVQIKGCNDSQARNVSNGSGDWLKVNKGDPVGGPFTYDLDSTDKKNNEEGVTSILRNFPNADRIVVLSSMQGTILAPHAHVTDAKYLKFYGSDEDKEKYGYVTGTMSDTGKHSSDDGNAHISGAVIAKSFEGNIEFGFRPFTGPLRMLSTTAGTRIAITKTDADDPTYNVPGAVFGIFAATNVATDENGNVTDLLGEHAVFSENPVETVQTGPDDEDFINLSSGYYVLREITAPEGYDRTDKEYYFIVKDEDVTVYVQKTDLGYVKINAEDVTEDATNIITVTFPKTTITICQDGDDTFKKTPYVAEYTYSPFRAADRTYQYNGGTIKFTISDGDVSVIPSSIEGAEFTDANGVTSKLTADELKNFHLVWVGEDGDGIDRDTGKTVHYHGFVIVYASGDTEEVLQPIITLTHVIQAGDNGFDGFNFEDHKILTINKIDEVTKKLLPGAEIELWHDGVKVEEGWTWDDATGQILVSNIILSEGNNHIYRLIESKVPDGYEDPTEDTIFAVIGNNLYISTVPHDAEGIPDEYLPVGNGKWAVRDIMTTDDNETAATSSANRTIEVENKKKGMSVVKTDGTNPISGAVLKLYAANGDEIGTFDFTESSAAQPLPEDSPYVDNGSLKPGTYYFEEVQEPSGYKKLTEPVYFVVNNDLSITAGKPTSSPQERQFNYNASWDNEWDPGASQYYLYNDNNELLVNWDGWNPAPLEVNKVEKIVLEFSQAGTQFRIRTKGNTISDFDATAENGFYTIETDKNGSSPFDFYENYFEIVTLYNTELKSITFYIQGEASGDDSGILKYENMTFKIKNDIDGYAVGISKVGADRPDEFLAGAHFKLSKWNDATQAYEVVSGCDYMESPDTLWTLALQEGKYKFEEIDAPDGYKIDEEPYYFEITATNEIRQITEPVETNRTPKKYVIGETYDGVLFTEEMAADTNLFVPAQNASSGDTYSFGWGDGLIGSGWYTSPNNEQIVKSITVYYSDGEDPITVYSDNDPNNDFNFYWTWNGFHHLYNFQNYTKKNNVSEIRAVLKPTSSVETLTFVFAVENDKAEFARTEGIQTSTTEEIEVTILGGGSAVVTEYYKLLDESTNKNGVIVTDNNPAKGKYVEAEIDYEDTTTSINTKNITLTVTHGATIGTAEYNTLALTNTYKIGEEEYELTIVPDADPTKAQIQKDGVPFDLDGRLSVKKLDGEAPYQYVIFDNAEKKVLYPAFYDDNNLLLTKNLSNFEKLQDGLKIVNETDTTRPDITISKIGSDTNKEITGAQMKLTNTDEASLEGVTAEGAEITISGNTITWTTTGTSPKFTGLPDGNYTLEEVAAPSGYLVAGEMTFEISGGKVNGKVTTVTMTDQRKPVKINKVDINGGAELAGAKLVLYKQNPDGSRGEKVGEWTSELNEVWEIILEDGDYVLVEEVAPDGYAIAEETKFTVENGEVKPGSVTSKFVDGVILVEDDLTEIEIGKITKGSEGFVNLPGAKMKLTYTGTASTANVIPPDETSEASGTSVRAIDAETEQSWIWTSTADNAVFRGLPDGHYVLEEIEAPNGYQIAAKIEFDIVNGEIDSTTIKIVDGSQSSCDGNVIKMFDEKSKVSISKVDATGHDELEGAELWVYTKEDYQKYQEDEISFEELQERAIDHWKSGTDAHEIEGILDGDYVIVEEVAPDGYTITSETEFTVESGEVTDVKGTTNEDGVILIEDTLSEIEISKKDLADTIKELPGAKLKLTLNEATKTNDATLENVTAVDKDNEEVELTLDETTKKSITWTSGDTSVVFKGLPDGTYTLSEEAPPEGYEGLAEGITFEIKNGIITTTGENISKTLITVFNTKKQNPGVEMPSTGGIGNARTYQMMGLGLTELTMIAFALKKCRRRKTF